MIPRSSQKIARRSQYTRAVLLSRLWRVLMKVSRLGLLAHVLAREDVAKSQKNIMYHCRDRSCRGPKHTPRLEEHVPSSSQRRLYATCSHSLPVALAGVVACRNGFSESICTQSLAKARDCCVPEANSPRKGATNYSKALAFVHGSPSSFASLGTRVQGVCKNSKRNDTQSRVDALVFLMMALAHSAARDGGKECLAAY